jgi:LysR family glycine cleavage system transcriptional activator
MQRPLPSLHAVKVFEAAARHQNFSRAAEELSVTQSAVSRQIQQLEAELGQALFERNGPRLSLTRVGLEYLDIVQDGLAVIRQGTARLFRAECRPYVTVSTLPSMATKWLVPRLESFERQHPKIRIRVATSYELVDFDVEIDVDAAIRHGRGQWAQVHMEHLVDEVLFPVCSPVLATKLKRPEDLSQQRLLLDDPRVDQWKHWAQVAGVEIAPNPRDRLSDDFNIQLQASMLGQGVALARSLLVADDLRAGRLVCPFKIPVRSHFQSYFVCPPTQLKDQAVKTFADWVSRTAKDTVAGLDRYIGTLT